MLGDIMGQVPLSKYSIGARIAIVSYTDSADDAIQQVISPHSQLGGIILSMGSTLVSL